MSRQLEQLLEKRRVNRNKRIVEAVEYGLSDAIERAGGELVGLAVKLHRGDCMLVIKVVLAGKNQVAFVGAEDFGSALIKAVREGGADRLRWRADRYVGQSEVGG